MSNLSCCFVDCKNTIRKSECKFYKFPTAKWKKNQKQKWIVAVRRCNVDGSSWVLKPYDYICSEHFIGDKTSNVESSPSYAPTIFPSIYKFRKNNASSATKRFERVMNRRFKKTSLSAINSESNIIASIEEITVISQGIVTEQKTDQECQVNFYSDSDVNSQTFICNRFVKDEICHAETQTEIVEDTRWIKININTQKFVDKGCGAPQKELADEETQVDNKSFSGFVSLTKKQEIIDLAFKAMKLKSNEIIEV